jgi:thiol:disulfide interchange protein DsbD
MARTITRTALAALTAFACASSFAQTQAAWSAALVPSDARAGESAQIVITAKMKDTWHLYSIVRVEKGPAPTIFEVKPSEAFERNGEVVEPGPIRKLDNNFGVEVGYFEKMAKFGIPVSLSKGAAGKVAAEIDVTWMACTDRQCTPVITTKIPLAFTISPGAARAERLAAVTSVPEQPAQVQPKPAEADGEADSEFGKNFDAAKGAGILPFLGFCFSMGLLALLTPCVFPMVPITVSFFAKKGDAGKSNTSGALAYCFGIMATFTGVGLLMTALFGATGIQRLANNPFVNFGLALLFVLLALNLFGVFEIRLPSSLTSKAASKSKAAGLVGPILMGFTFTLTTFTCTVPLVGTLLISAASGDWMYPALGMLAFSLAFALPFFLLALFPQVLNNLPKSGAWMAAVKVFLGFIELLAAVKFLSNVDLFYDWGILTREVFLAIWTAVMAITAAWLFGWLKLPNEGEQKIGWRRRVVGLASTVCMLWFLGGVSGKSLGELNGFLPPDPYPGRKSTKEFAIDWVHDYDQALTSAKAQNKPIFINFTGANCTNCRWMEANMFPDPEVYKVLSEVFVPVELWTDRLNPKDKANQKIQVELTGDVTLPIYAVISPEGKVIKLFPGSTRDKQEFLKFLNAAKSEYSALAVR